MPTANQIAGEPERLQGHASASPHNSNGVERGRSNLEVWRENAMVINNSVWRCTDRNHSPEPFIKVKRLVESRPKTPVLNRYWLLRMVTGFRERVVVVEVRVGWWGFLQSAGSHVRSIHTDSQHLLSNAWLPRLKGSHLTRHGSNSRPHQAH